MPKFSALKQAIRKVRCYALTVSHTDLSNAYCDVQANFLIVTVRIGHFQVMIFFKRKFGIF